MNSDLAKLRAVLDDFRPVLKRMTPRERDIILVSGAHFDKQAADVLGITINSLRTFRQRISRKIGIHNPKILFAVLLSCTTSETMRQKRRRRSVTAQNETARTRARRNQLPQRDD